MQRGYAKRDWFCPQILSEGHDGGFLETENGKMHQLSYLETPSMWGIVNKQPLPRGCVLIGEAHGVLKEPEGERAQERQCGIPRAGMALRNHQGTGIPCSAPGQRAPGRELVGT